MNRILSCDLRFSHIDLGVGVITLTHGRIPACLINPMARFMVVLNSCRCSSSRTLPVRIEFDVSSKNSPCSRSCMVL